MKPKPDEDPPRPAPSGLTPLVREIVRPYHGWIAVILVAMLLETAASIAAPWPLKVVIDSVVGHHPLPGWATRLLGAEIADDKASLALAAGISVVLIALFGAIATYVDNYYTESVGQWVANDLRLKVYRHLDRLSLAWYD
ncbi:MAG: ABC transporter transmembrane domain-containing protein, partial [Alphaproteobacteria bacterium]